MRELTVKVSDSQFEMLVNFLRALPYVQLPPSLKKKDSKEQIREEKSLSDNSNLKEPLFDLSSLGEIDNTPFDMDDIKKNYSINWENFHEVIELFKDIPLENHIEQHTELHAD